MEALITGVDLFTAVGASAEVTYFSVRAGLSRFTETGAVNRQRKPRIAAVLPGFRHTPDERRLVTMAIESAMRALDSARVDSRRIGVILCLPGPPRPDAMANLDSWTHAFSEAFDRNRVALRMRAFAEGSASIALAIRDALSALDRGDDDATIIGGADSWLPLRTLRWLESTRRLKIGERIDGLITGEAAGFVVVESPRRRAGREKPLAVVRAASIAYEPGHYESEEPCLSVGYTEAVRAALRDGEVKETPSVLVSDLNGESYKAKEWAVAEVRALPNSPVTHIHPADCFGDVGSLSGVCELGIAAMGLSRGELSASAMVVAGSDGAARAVVVADALDGRGTIEPDLAAPIQVTPVRPAAAGLSAALVDDHLEEAGFLRLQRRLAEERSAEMWSLRDGHDRRHAWHLLALTASAPHATQALLAAVADRERPAEDRAAAVAALALAQSSSIDDAIREMLDGQEDRAVFAIAEAAEDLPETPGSLVRRRLRESGDPRMHELAETLLASVPVDERALLTAIERSSAVDARQRAVSLLAKRNSDALRAMLVSSGLVGVVPAETIAWATAHLALRDAPRMARALDDSEITPRLLTALGGTGYTDIIELLLRFVDDDDQRRADAAASALAALSGVDLIEPGNEDEAGNEMWSRSAERWTSALTRIWSSLRSHERVVRGVAWSEAALRATVSDPSARNGVRRPLAIALARDGHPLRTTSYYWLQPRRSN